MKKRTHEEYVQELRVKNPNIVVAGTYVDANTSTLHYCLLHDVFLSTTPSRALSGVGCEECRKEKFHQSRCRSHSAYIDELAIVNPNIEVLEEYIDARTPILHRCKIDGHRWRPTPSNILCGHGCPKCRDRYLHQQRAKTQAQYEAEVAELHPTIKVLGIYVNSEIEILHQCMIDGHIWMAKPGNILSAKGCPKCAGNIRLTREEYIERLKLINPNIVPIEDYIDSRTPILHRCLIDEHIWPIRPYSALRGCGCPKCAGNARKTPEQYRQELLIVNPDIEALEDYIDSKTPISHRCKIDGFVWAATPCNILSGTGCPHCQQSKGEECVARWLTKGGFNYTYQKKFVDCRDKIQLPFDFYLPEHNILIEYDGIQHFQPVDFAGKGEEWAMMQFQITQSHDTIKTQYCKNNNIRLLRIPYFKNVEEELEKFLFI